MNAIAYALPMAKRFHDKGTYDHALRVATYVAENPMIDEENMENSSENRKCGENSYFCRL